MHLSCLGPVSGNISHPDIFSSYCREWLQSNGCQMVQVFFLSALEGWNCWWLWHPYVLIWQEIVHFSPRNNFRESYLSTTVEEKKWTLHFQPNKFISISNPHIYWFSATLSSPREITCQRKWRICANRRSSRGLQHAWDRYKGKHEWENLYMNTKVKTESVEYHHHQF